MGNTQTVYDDGLYIRPNKINNPNKPNITKKYCQNNSTSNRSRSLIDNKNKNKSEQSLQKVFGIDDQSLLRSYWQHQPQQEQIQNMSKSYISKCKSNSKSIIHNFKIRHINKENQEDKVSQNLINNRIQKQCWEKMRTSKKSVAKQRQKQKKRKILSPVNQNANKKQENILPYEQDQSESVLILPNSSKNNQSSLNRCRQKSEQFPKKEISKKEECELSMKSYNFNYQNNFSISQSNVVELLKESQIEKRQIGKSDVMFDGETFQYQHNQERNQQKKQDCKSKLQRKASALNLQSSVVNIFNIVQKQNKEKQIKLQKNNPAYKDQQQSSLEESESQRDAKQNQLKTIISKLDQIYEITKNRQQQELNQFVLNNQILLQNSEVGTIKRQILTPKQISINDCQYKKNKQIEELDILKSQAKNISIWKLQQLQLEREEMYKQEYQAKNIKELRKQNQTSQLLQQKELNSQLKIILQNSRSNKQLKSPSNRVQNQFTNIRPKIKSPINKVSLNPSNKNISIQASQIIENQQIYSVRSNILYQNQHIQNTKSQHDLYQRKFFKSKKSNSSRSKQNKKCSTQYLNRIKQLQNELSIRKIQDQMQKYESRKCSPVKKQLTTPRCSQISHSSVEQSDKTIIEAAHFLISKHRNKYFKLK